MKKFISVMLLLVIGAVAFAYAVDYLCMQNGEAVMFSTWGKDYTASVGTENSESATDFSDTKAEQVDHEENDTVQICLYFSDESFMKLEKEMREFKTGESLPSDILSALISGPDSKNMYSLLPPDASVLSAHISDDGLCTVDLSSEFCNFEGGSYMENMAICSVVNSLCSYEKINKVKINIDGKENAMFGNHFSLEDVLEEGSVG